LHTISLNPTGCFAGSAREMPHRSKKLLMAVLRKKRRAQLEEDFLVDDLDDGRRNNLATTAGARFRF
jgi:hypothetical protein